MMMIAGIRTAKSSPIIVNARAVCIHKPSCIIPSIQSTKSWKWFAIARESIEMDVDVRPETIHGDQSQIATKIASILKSGRQI